MLEKSKELVLIFRLFTVFRFPTAFLIFFFFFKLEIKTTCRTNVVFVLICLVSGLGKK